MVTAALPFRPVTDDHGHGGDISQCPVFRMLPKKLLKESKTKSHLRNYLHLLPVDEIGVPKYHETLDRSLGDLQDPNIIYPLDNGTFVHIYPDLGDARNYYVAIEPGMTEDLSTIIEDVETRLVDFVGDLDEGVDDEKRTQILLKSLDKVCAVSKKSDNKKIAARGKCISTQSSLRPYAT